MAALHQPRINYLRLSTTDRCNLRCVYCTYWRDWEEVASSEILRYEELLRIVRAAASAGITKVRVTGGEPRPRWVVWKLEERNGKPSKVPYNPKRPQAGAMSNNPET